MIEGLKVMAFLASKSHEQAKEFFVGKLGFKLLGEDNFAMVFDAAGVMLRVQKLKDFTPQQFTVLGWEVDDIALAIDKLKERGLAFAVYPWIEQDERGIWTTPDGARVAWFNDPDGNILSLTQFPKAG